MAEIMVQRTARPPRGILVPIPLGPRRLGTRGYNQAAEIARALATYWKLPVSEKLLRRSRETKTQTALAPEERERNVQGAFVATPPGQPRGQQGQECPAPTVAAASDEIGGHTAVILIDDVLTTGATLVAAARPLEDAGWKQIEAVTFARALPYGCDPGS
jgi:predicted amidophosphoribosyltransferase